MTTVEFQRKLLLLSLHEYIHTITTRELENIMIVIYKPRKDVTIPTHVTAFTYFI
jgi:hypothetical protein